MKTTRVVTTAAIIAALYVALGFVSHSFTLASGVVQVRLSEALTVLPLFSPAAIPGLVIGCFITNIITGCLPWDIVFGTAATLIGAVGTHFLRKKSIYLACLPPILANTAIIPFVLKQVYGESFPIYLIALCVFIGEFIACGVLGTLLSLALKKHADSIFKG